MGRPTLIPGSPKSASFSTRITRDMRASLDAEAARLGLTVSQVAERWMERGRAAWAAEQALIREAHANPVAHDPETA